MHRNRNRELTLARETVKLLATRELTLPRGGVTGPPCDVETKQATKCDFGCATGGSPCFGESAQTQGNC